MKFAHIVFFAAWAGAILMLQNYPALSEQDSKVPELVIDMLQTKMYMQTCLLVFPTIFILYLVKIAFKTREQKAWPPEGYVIPAFAASVSTKVALQVLIGLVLLAGVFFLLQCFQIQHYIGMTEALAESFPAAN